MVSVLAVTAVLALATQATTAQQRTMPSVVNMPMAEAVTVVRRLDVRMQFATAAGPPARALTIQRQSPQAGAVITGQTVVVLTVSMIAVPDLSGMMATDVAQRLSANRLRLGRATEIQINRPPGTVVRQSPGAGSLVAPDSAVDIYYVQAPPQPPPVLMPSVINQTLAAATSIIGRHELRIDTLRVAGPPERAMRIVRQSPAARTPITPQTVASITVSMIAVPDLTGMGQAQAIERLQEHSLRLGATSTAVTSGDSGRVFRQQPRALELVAPATAVDVVYVQPAPQPQVVPPQVVPPPVNNPPPQTTTIDTTPTRPPPRADSVVVPSVRGWSLTSARRILEASGLRLGRMQVALATDTITMVLSQSPESGTRVQRGAAIDVTVPTLVSTSRNRPIWPWIAGGLLMLAGIGAGVRSRLSKHDRELVERAKSIVTVSPVSPLKLHVQNRSALQDTSIRYVVRSGGTRIEVRAQVPLVIKEERTHV